MSSTDDHDAGGGPKPEPNTHKTFDLNVNTWERLSESIPFERDGEIIISGQRLWSHDDSNTHSITLCQNQGDASFNYRVSFHQKSGKLDINAKIDPNDQSSGVNLGVQNDPATDGGRFEIVLGWDGVAKHYWGKGSGWQSNMWFRIRRPEDKEQHSYYIHYESDANSPLFGNIVQIEYNTGDKRRIEAPPWTPPGNDLETIDVPV